MTNETKRRILAYTEELPHMKEKVFGALLMLVIAAMVTVTSTYAWVTLSRSPEVSDIKTTLAANGALEIALSKPDGTQPDEFDVDESLISSNNVTVTNLQWGNLVNLSDSSYNIDKMKLYPASLNSGDLEDNPLGNVQYGEDGRITQANNTTFARYDETVGGFVAVNENYGVRAIASYKIKTSDATTLENETLIQAVSTAKTIVNEKYEDVKTALPKLENLISRVAQDIINANSEVAYDASDVDNDLAKYLPNVEEFYLALKGAMEAQFDAYLALANLQHYQWCKNNTVDYTPYASWDSVVEDYNAKREWLSINGLGTFINDYNTLVTDLGYVQDYIKAAENGAQYYWEPSNVASNPDKNDASVAGYTLQDMVSRLIAFEKMTIKVGDSTLVLVKIMNYGKSKLLEMYNNGSGTEYDMYIPDSILQRFEQYALDSTKRMDGKSTKCTVTVSGKYIITLKDFQVVCLAQTTATGESLFNEDYGASKENTIDAKDKAIEDTCGMAIDLWVRTNAEKTCLKLEAPTTTDESGNYLSYNGVNRVWGYTYTDDRYPKISNTTQGGGSCYTYYADTPEDMARSLDVLDAMKVAFVDDNGILLAIAEMDTENYLAVNGRVTVPLVLTNTAAATYTTEDGQTGYAITTLYANKAERVTAIVYLEGDNLRNEHVLATAEIQGILNLQFSSSEKLDTMGDSELLYATRTVSAWLDDSKDLDGDSYTEENTITLSYDDAKVAADLTATVMIKEVDENGKSDSDLTEVTAFFVRAINTTQGTREQTMTFKKEGDNWVSSYTFTAPGEYYLRQVRLDGVDYTLDNPPKVVVKGFGLADVFWSESSNDVTIRTSEGSHSTKVTVQFSATNTDRLPSTVRAVFMRDDGNTVSVPLTQTTQGWVGTATFTASGVYQLKYLLANEKQYIDLALDDEGNYRTLDLSLGMYVEVQRLEGALSEPYEAGKSYPRELSVEVYNNAGVELKELEGLVLYYGTSSSNSIDNNLTWDAQEQYYTTTLNIVNPGRYSFIGMQMEGSMLTKWRGEEPPTFTIISPDPPIFDVENSQCTYTGENIQYVPLTNKAVIDGIIIRNTSAASTSAVVYNAETNSYYTAEMEYSGNYYVKDDETGESTVAGGIWHVNLPTYSIEANGQPAESQDGQWSLAAIYLWECYDENSNFREITEDNPETTDKDETKYNPILWIAEGNLGQGYLDTMTEENAYVADATKDFSKLTTNVSSEVYVYMDAGTTVLGINEDGSVDAFGTIYQVSETNMYVKVLDGYGNPIPANVAVDISLNVIYSGNTGEKNVEKYGYEVTDVSESYEIKLNDRDDENGWYNISAVTGLGIKNYWSYAGVYKVDGLTVKIGDAAVDEDFITDVPSVYTVTTAPPTLDNVSLTNVALGNLTYSGEFLASFDLSKEIAVTLAVTGEGEAMNNAVVPGLNVSMNLDYQEGSCETYGGYTYDGSTGYESPTLTMTKAGGSGGIYYGPSSQTLLAGVYTPTTVVISDGGTDEITVLSSYMDSVKNIYVWSDLPDVKITGVSSAGDTVVVSTNADPRTNYLTENNPVTFNAQNKYDEPENTSDTDYGRWAVVYMGYAEGASDVKHQEVCDDTTSARDSYYNYADYTQPGIKFKLSNGGTGTANINVDGIGSGSVTLTNDAESEFILIGKINTDQSGLIDQHWNWATMSSWCYCIYTTEAATPLGTKTINTVTSTVGTATITRTLANPITISQPSQENPTLTLDADGVTIELSYNGATYNSRTNDFPVLAELTATVTTDFGYHDPYLEEPDGVYDWTRVSYTDTTAVYTFKMSLDNATLNGSATRYPTIDFSNANNAEVSVSVAGNTIFSKTTGVKDGEQVTVTVTRTGNYCLPEMAEPSDVISWAKDEAKSNDFTSVYTFIMPEKAVSLPNPTTTAMYQVKWDTEQTAMLVYVQDQNGALSSGDYAVPGHTLTVNLVATGGYRPRLAQNDYMTEWTSNEDNMNAEYTFKFNVPGGILDLKLSAVSYPAVKLDNDYASFTVKNAGSDVTSDYVSGQGVGIKPGNLVTVVLTRKEGYHDPRMSLPDNVTAWYETPDESETKSTYSFIMPEVAVDASSKIVATGYIVTYDANDGYCGTPSQTYAGTVLTHPTPTRTGYKFLGWYTASGTKIEDGYTPSADITLYAQWTGYVVTYNANGGSCSTTTATYTGTALTLPTPTRSDYTFNGWYTAASGGNKAGDAGASYTPSADITLYAQWTKNSGTCLAAGTMITMADGTKKAVEDMRKGDIVIAVDHQTGEVVDREVIIVVRNPGEFYKNTFIFDDGTELPTINEHGVFDLELNMYVNIDHINYKDFIGHRFVSIDPNGNVGAKRLVDVTSEYTSGFKYDIVTDQTLNYVAEDTLSVTHGLVAGSNTFAYGDNLVIDYEKMQADIEKYGLYSYEDWKEYCDSSVFEQYNIALYKVGVEKNLYTVELIIDLLNTYVYSETAQIIE